MALPDELALTHQQAQSRLARQAAAGAVAVWDRLDQDALTASWNAGAGARMVNTVAQAQTQAASLAPAYLAALAAAQGLGDLPGPRLIPSAFGGIASDGRPLVSLLYLPIILFKRLLSRGTPPVEAMTQARTFLALTAATQVADAGRAAVTTGMVAEKRWVTYVRVVHLPACSRCILLAGKQYSWSTGFLRHPNCDCGMQPWHEGDEPPPTPKELFARMPPEEQNRRFGKAGAEAIRLGADIGQIVNARRGMTTAAQGRKVTTEGTTVRGLAGRRMGNLKKAKGERYRRSQTIRPMPEQLLADAAGDRDEAIRLLRRFSYIV